MSEEKLDELLTRGEFMFEMLGGLAIILLILDCIF